MFEMSLSNEIGCFVLVFLEYVCVFQFLCDCMEVQFESVIEDRPLLLSTFELLHNTIPSIPALSWEFFLRLFNILIAESQYEVSQGRNPVFPATPASSNETAAINADVSRDGKLDKAKLVRERSGAVLLQSVAQHFHQKSGKIDLKRTVSVTVGSSSSPNAGGGVFVSPSSETSGFHFKLCLYSLFISNRLEFSM